MGQKAVIIAVLILLSTHLADAKGFTVFGLGNKSCGTWTADHQADNANALLQDSWLGGYVSAYNNYVPAAKNNVASSTDFNGMREWVSNYCSLNPLDRIDTAAQKLLEALRGRPH